MKLFRVLVCFFFAGLEPALSQGLKLAAPALTRWGKEISATNLTTEYPRPTMARLDWLSLNGEWDCAITRRDVTNAGDFFNRKILVPFPVESVLSGVKRVFTEQQRLWYRRKVNIPKDWNGRRVLLHFEAVDWETRVWLNGHELGMHRGGYDRFTFDITDALKTDGEQELTLSVFDPSDAGYQPRGKQIQRGHGTFYGASSGIWQTVWLEPVAPTRIESLHLTTEIDAGTVMIGFVIAGETNGVSIEATAFDGEKEVARVTGSAVLPLQLNVKSAKLWSPDSPFLYDLKVTLLQNGRSVDTVTSYFGMRKISIGRDANGFPNLELNNKALFQLGPLDQGFWPDGQYTAPSDEALRSDIETIKSLGFNMCRKHVKVEPERWYYWCDKLGLLVWQDMPSGDRASSARQPEIARRPESAAQFELELTRMIEGRGNHPCIVVWVPFNQGWGQYDTKRIAELVKGLDPTRLVVCPSGWYDMGAGDVLSLHQYPGPAKPVHDGKRPCVLGESGGYGLLPPGWHGSSWNTVFAKTPEELSAAYTAMMGQIEDFRAHDGLSAAVITQLTDVETEINGFMTYDRQSFKMPVEKIRAANAIVLGGEK